MFSQGLSPDQCRAELANFERDARLNPQNAGCLGNYAAVLFTLGRVAESIPIFEQACALDAKQPGNFINMAMAYKEDGRYDDAARALEYGYQADPDNFYHALGYSESLLRAGLWREAWPIYEDARITKFSTKNEQSIPAALPELKRANLELLEKVGQLASLLPDGSRPSIAVYGEGGIGDRICYARFLPWLERYGFAFEYFPDASIINNPGFSCSSLFSRLPWAHSRGLDGKEIVASAWTTQFALLALFRTTPTSIPDFPSPFVCDDVTEKNFAQLFAGLRNQNRKPIIALVWNAGEKFEGERKFRSMTHVQAARLAVSCPGYNWINANINTQLSEPFIQVNPWQTWEHTAAILKSCDGVISVDTGPMHLAGALKCPLWIALSGNSDWKFLLKTKKCYWYRHAEIFRNTGCGFEHTINQLIERLNAGDYPGRQNAEPIDVHSRVHHHHLQPCDENSVSDSAASLGHGGNGASRGPQREPLVPAHVGAGDGER